MDILEIKGLVHILNRWCHVDGKVNLKIWCETSDWWLTKQTLYMSAFWSFTDGYLTNINTFCTISRKFGGIKKRNALWIFPFKAMPNECEFLARLTHLNTIWSISGNPKVWILVEHGGNVDVVVIPTPALELSQLRFFMHTNSKTSNVEMWLILIFRLSFRFVNYKWIMTNMDNISYEEPCFKYRYYFHSIWTVSLDNC